MPGALPIRVRYLATRGTAVIADRTIYLHALPDAIAGLVLAVAGSRPPRSTTTTPPPEAAYRRLFLFGDLRSLADRLRLDGDQPVPVVVEFLLGQDDLSLVNHFESRDRPAPTDDGCGGGG